MNTPFNPNFEMQLMVLLDRIKLLTQSISDIKDLDAPYRATLIYGARGFRLMVGIDSKINFAVIRRVVQLTDGYVYTFQLLGCFICRAPDERIAN